MGWGNRSTTEFKREAARLALASGRPRAEIAEHDFSQRRACRLIEVNPKTVRRRPLFDVPEVR